MDEDEVIRRFGLPPRADDVPAIRAELADATRLESADAGDTLVLKALSVLLFAAGHVEDSLVIWRAKRASFDAGFSIDVQLLCGAGFAATTRYLEAADSDEARAALACILQCEAAGDFEGHDEPGGRLAGFVSWFKRYYEVE